jgi:hypothetical protein
LIDGIFIFRVAVATAFLFLEWNSFLDSKAPAVASTFCKPGAEKISSPQNILNPGRPLEHTPSGLFPGDDGSSFCALSIQSRGEFVQ